MRLEEFGWDSVYQDWFQKDREMQEGAALPERSRGFGIEPGRVRLARQAGCVLFTARGEVEATVAGRLSQVGERRPVVGDWVAFSWQQRRVEAVLTRRTEIARRRPGAKAEPQVLAANVDLLLVVTAFGRDFRLGRLERYLLLARQSGAAPVVVLNKLDECSDPAAALRQVRPVAGDAPVVLMSALDAVGLEDLLRFIEPAQTAALVGSSGVGKSTIINRLLGEERQLVRELGDANRRGRHTTTDRELFVLPGGQLLIDSPGLRELQLWADPESMESGFPDIDELAGECRFRDCRHQGEPGCAVAAAVERGDIDARRLENYHKIGRELRRLELQVDDQAAYEERRRMKRLHKQYRKIPHR
jgi:ribosome biogenesis GTPase